jgi:hypothetical protein
VGAAMPIGNRDCVIDVPAAGVQAPGRCDPASAADHIGHPLRGPVG